jgi:hypothetical protein
MAAKLSDVPEQEQRRGDTRAPDSLAGRGVPRIYNVSRRTDLHDFLCRSIQSSGGTLLYASSPNRVPVYLGIDRGNGARLGLMIYPFRMTRVPTRNRPSGEIRGQLRYGSESSWLTDDHRVARDIAGVDTTLLLGLFPEGDLIVGLDPALYDPLPLGISAAYLREPQVEQVARAEWLVWERENRGGERRAAPRAAEGLETVVAFHPRRLLDYAAFERQANDLGLDPPLRYAAALDAAPSRRSDAELPLRHALESRFDLSARDILDIIHTRMRLEVAVKGGVAEHHLERRLLADPAVADVRRLDRDAQPDFDVTLSGGQRVLVECKNVSPEPYANGDYKVEVQKTRATRDDPAGRLYRPDQFDVVAACLYSPTRRWDFRYRRTAMMDRHSQHPDRLAATHRVDTRWSESLEQAVSEVSGGLGAS